MQRVVLKDGKECGEWTLNGEATTYDPCPPSLEGGNQPPSPPGQLCGEWFVRLTR
jgi:hypothetical protein